MRPERPDIAAPPFHPAAEWVGGAPVEIERLCAKGPVLVHFFEASEASSYRSLGYVKAWAAAYADHGLRVVGVHTPRSEFAAATADLAAAIGSLGIDYPVLNDSGREAWRDYGCRGWPALFLWKRGGALLWAHMGEGDYAATEAAIREALAGPDDEGSNGSAEQVLPDPIAPVRPSDEPGAKVVPPTPEVFPGGGHEQPLEGSGAPLELVYEAGAAYLAASGSGTVGVSIDGEAARPLGIDGPGMHTLAEHGTHGAHELVLAPSAGTRLWSVGFGAGVP